MATLTAYNLIYDALRKVGVVSLGDTVAAEVSEEALRILNTLRSEWSINIKVNKRFDQLYTVVGPKQFITLGSTTYLGDFTGKTYPVAPLIGDTLTDSGKSYAYDGIAWVDYAGIAKRPAQVDKVVICQGAPQSNLNIDLPIYTYAEYRSMSAQNISAIPNFCYVDNQFPESFVYFYPGLNSGWTVRVIGTDYLTEYENISDEIVEPPEYFNGLSCALALRLCQNYGSTPGEGLVQQANSAMKHIKEHNFIVDYAQRQGSSQSKSSINFFSGR